MPTISMKEAEQAYPTQYWDEYPTVKKTFEATADDLQEAYIRGREAAITDEEIEAAAQIYALDTHNLDEPPEEFWNTLSEAERTMFRKYARPILEAARKAVTGYDETAK